mgnify:CR=1 FL=1
MTERELLRMIRLIRVEDPNLLPYQIALSISRMTDYKVNKTGLYIKTLIEEHLS